MSGLLHKCCNVGCMKLIPMGQPYCSAHADRPKTVGSMLAQKTKKKNPEYDHRWNVVSRGYRAEHPHCEMCLREKVFTPVALVDHITPVRIAPERKYDYDNLMSLCYRHHHYKTLADKKKYPELALVQRT